MIQTKEEALQYAMSFTTGGLFLRESVKLAELLLEVGSWCDVRERVFSDNLLQTRTRNTAVRVFREVSSRLKQLEPGEIDLLVNGTSQEQQHLLWIAICRRYRFIAEFATEVIRERYISLKGDLSLEDFDAFFNRKADWHQELDAVMPATRKKLRQVLFRILREADLLARDTIVSPMLSPRLVETLSGSRRKDLLLFPVFESDLRAIIQ